MTNNKINIKKLFSALDEEMRIQLSSKIDEIYHPAAKGQESELNWIWLLRTYLPERYKIDSWFIVDHEWSISEQMDVIIYDRHFTPFIFRWKNILYIPVEGVYAVFEVKPDLSKVYLDYALKKYESVLGLKRTSASFNHIGGNSTKGILNFNIIWGFLCNKDKSRKVYEDFSIASQLDILVCLCKGVKINNTITEINNNENILSFFILKLIEKMRSLGSVPALEVNKYLEIE